MVGLVGCGGGAGEEPLTGRPRDTVAHSGSIGDGPAVRADVSLFDANGKLVARTTSDGQARYRVEIPADTAYPVTIAATGGTDLVTAGPLDFTLFSTALTPAAPTANANPFSTLIVQTAQWMEGGLNAENVAAARETVMTMLGFGLDRTLVHDPLSEPVTETNAAHVIKASEALAEAIRRAQSTLAIGGGTATNDEIIAVLAGDMADGTLDGAGANADLRVAASMTAASAEVYLETIQNHLRVGGADATQRLDQAIRTTSPTTASTTADVPISTQALAQARANVEAVETLTGDSAVSTALTQLIAEDAATLLAEEVETSLAGLDVSAVKSASTTLVTASDAQLQRMAEHVRTRSRDLLGTGEPQTPTDGADPPPADEPTAPADGSNPPGDDPAGDDGTDADPIDGSRPPIVIRINASGPEVTDTAGNTWSADTGFVGGSTALKPNTITGTSDPVLYQSERWDDADGEEMEYRFDVPDGVYSVNLHFAEQSRIAFSAGSRLFDVEIEGQTVFDNLDVYREAGAYAALVKRTAMVVTDGQLNIRFLHEVQNPMVNAIEILEQRGFGVVDGISASTVSATHDGPFAIRVSESGEEVKVSGMPAHGTALVLPDSTILYIPDTGFIGADTITYSLTDTKGNVSVANLTVEIGCNDCAGDPVLALSWQPNSEVILGYRVYYGTSEQDTNTRLPEIPLDSTGFDPQAPSISYLAQTQLGLNAGSHVCFRIKAYNEAGESPFSEAICTDL